MNRPELAALAKPFPDRYIHRNPSGGGDYVAHPLVTQKVLATLPGYSFTLVQVLRGHVAAVPPNPNGKSDRARNGVPALDDAVVGVVMRLEATIDGHRYVVEEVGDCEQPHNWPTDGARLKDAMSDAFKRCAMRVGVGLHLWSQKDGFFLFDALSKGDGPPAVPKPPKLAPGTES